MRSVAASVFAGWRRRRVCWRGLSIARCVSDDEMGICKAEEVYGHVSFSFVAQLFFFESIEKGVHVV